MTPPPPTRRSAGERAVAAVLRHPLGRALKRLGRDLWWRLKAIGIRNPKLPERVESVLFVCLGNICRSPFAALVASNRSPHPGPARRFASAGISTKQAARPPREACDAGAVYGVGLSDHRPQTLTRELMEAFDLIVVMEATQLERLRRSYPDAAARVVLLSLFDPEATGGYERCNIADPFSRPRAEFDACYRRIDRATAKLLAELDSAAGRG
jgi:protein-tyrosine phosphatase